MNEKTISGSYVAEATEKFASLTIAPEAVLAAPAGKCLTLTVDGINRQIEPGTYTGDVVLTVSDAVQVDYENHGKVDHFEMAKRRCDFRWQVCAREVRFRCRAGGQCDRYHGRRSDRGLRGR